MWLVRFFQTRRLFAHYITLIVLILGVYVFSNMQRESRPNVNFNSVLVSATYLGASPKDVEELVIDPIEEKIKEVDGVKEIRSVAFSGLASISVTIDDSYPDPEKISAEVRRKVAEVNDLPADVKSPVVNELKSTEVPVLEIALYGSLDPLTFKLETEKLKDFLQNQKGVQSVNYRGISGLQLQMLVKKSALTSFDITLDEILSKLSAWAKEKPGGLFEGENKVANIGIGESLDSVETFGRFILRSNDSGKKIRLSDLAEIKFALRETQTSYLFEDKTAALFSIVKKPFEDAINVASRVKKSVLNYQKELPSEIKIKTYGDDSILVKNKLRVVTSNAIGGLLLVLFILLLFLDWRASLVTVIGIPVAVCAGMVVLYLLGHTINSLLIIGAIVVMGMLVDDAIVVCENIYSYLEKGFAPREAAFKGISEMALPVLSSVLTTVFAFLPIVFMKGIMGSFLKVIPITVIAMLVASLLEAIFILPVHAEEIMRFKKSKKKRFFSYFEAIYKRYVGWSIRYRWLLLFVLSGIMGASFYQGKQVFETFALFPAKGLVGFGLKIEGQKNVSVDVTRAAVEELSRRLIKVSEGTFDSVTSKIGESSGGFSGSLQRGSHLARMVVAFHSDPEFIYKEKRILKKIRDVIDKFSVEKNIKTYLNIARPGPPVGKPVEFQITSRDFDFGSQVAEWIKAELKKIKGMVSVESDLDGDILRYALKIDNERAVSEGVDPAKISRTIFTASTGSVVSEILKNNDKVEVLLSIKDRKKYKIQDILGLKVRNNNGQAIPLRTFVSIRQERSPSAIQRLNGLRTITVFGEIDEKIVSSQQVNKKIAPFLNSLREKYKFIEISTGGSERQRLEALVDTLKLYVIAIILIFMTISLTFQSVVYPLLVLTAIPMGVVGVVWALTLHQSPLSLMGIIGVVGLSGVVVNVSIIFLKFVQNRLKEGKDFYQSIIEAGVNRLRPIVITTISTLTGLVPTIYGIGGVDTFVQPIALVLGWGLFIATILTILFLPSMISFFTILGKQKYHKNDIKT